MSSLTDKELFLQQQIFPSLEKGRKDWDVPHTKAVVHYIQEIIHHTPSLSLDETVLVIAAYAHDWGYAGLFSDGVPLTMKRIGDKKVQHMEIGAQKIQELLNNEVFNDLSNEQKERIVHLVAIHDKLDQLKDPDELILMEADTLGVLDVKQITPTFSQKEDLKWLSWVKENRFPKFITDYGKAQIDRLVSLRISYHTK